MHKNPMIKQFTRISWCNTKLRLHKVAMKNLYDYILFKKNYSFIDTKQKKLKTKFSMKSSVKWAVDSHHDSKVRRRNIMLAWKRWEEKKQKKIQIQESEDSYEDHYKIYWRFSQKRKNSKSTDSIPTKKIKIIYTHSISHKKSLKWAFDSHQVSKVRLWNITPI